MAQPVTDPELLRLLNQAPTPKAGARPVTDPDLLAQLNAEPIKGDASRWNAQGDAVDMLTMGLGNKAVAGGQALYDAAVGDGSVSDSYHRRLAQLRADQEAFGKEHPFAKRFGQGTGIVLGALAAPVATVAKGIGMAPRIANAALTGGAYGSVAGAAEDADSLAERAGNAVEGAAWGTALGAAAAPVAAGAGKLANKSWEWLRNQFTAQMPKADKTAITTILQQMQASGMTPREAWLKLQKLGPEAMIADVAPNMQAKLAQSALETPEATRMTVERLDARHAGGTRRANEVLDYRMGPKVDRYDFEVANKAEQRAAGKLFEISKEYEVDTAPVAELLAKEIRVAGPHGPYGAALQNVRKMLVDDAGNLISNGARIHVARQQIDDMASEAFRAGHGNAGNGLNNIVNGLRKSLHEGVPGFAEADAAYKAAKDQIKNFEFGRGDFYKGGNTPVTLAQTRALKPEARADIIQGARAHIGQKLTNERRNLGSEADKIFSRDENLEKTAELLQSPDAAADIANMIDAEQTFGTTRRIANPMLGSPTAMRHAADIQARPRTTPFTHDVALGAIATAPYDMGTAGAVAGAGRNILSRVGSMLGGRVSKEAVNATVDVLTTIEPARQKQVIDLLEKQLARIPKSHLTEKTIERILGGVLISAGVRTPPPDVPIPKGFLPQLGAP